MKTVLMVAEKPLLAQSIASILSNRQMTSRKGFNGACSVHEYTSSFMGQSAKFKMTSTCGHVMGLDFPGQYNNWDMVDPVDLFNCPVQKKEANSKMKMPQFLSSEGRGCDYLVLWLDCDKEGENICFEVIDCVLPMMRDPKRNDVIHRAKFSAITDRDIKAAMSSLILPNECESLSVDARQELDLRIGCAFTRFQTRYFQAKYGDLDSSLISFGPCQTPTLGFCVERHDKINSFKPETYWVVQPKLTLPAAVSEAGDEIYPEWPRGRVFDREVAGLFADRCRLCEAGKIVDITQKEGAKTRRQALNTVELMRVASAKLGIGPQQAMHIAEELLYQGYISYPRTETASYSENFDLRGAVKQLSNNGLHGDYIRDLLSGGMVKPRSGHDAGDHPPITPMRSDPNNSLSGDKGRIFDYIVRHFLASISPDSKFLVTTVRIDIGGEVFVQTGKQMIAPGFVAIVSIGGASDDVILPPFKRGQLLPLESVEIQERKTSPPDYLTEAELITLMEKNGIGTDANIPIDPELVLSTMRSELEKQLTLIAVGKADFHAVKSHALEIFKQKFQYFVQKIFDMDEMFEVSFTILAETGKPLSRCGKCRRFLKWIQTKPPRLHCSSCQDTYSLPSVRDALLRPYNEQKCPLDDFELVFVAPNAAKSFPLCPYCSRLPKWKRGRAVTNVAIPPADIRS